MTGTAEGTLAEFLLARIAEDEQTVRSGPDYMKGRQWFGRFAWFRNENNDDDLHASASFVLAECAAHRRIVESVHVDDPTFGDLTRRTCTNPYVLELLALPYADHPDYRDEWRP